MDNLSRSDYPAMLAHLQPNQAVRTLDDRVKRISKVNSEIAEWVAERRRIEDHYVQSLRKLTNFKVPNAHSELGVFQPPWDRILQSTHTVAQAHHHFSMRIEHDVEIPLRSLHSRKEMQNVTQISTSLANMAKELEDAQSRSEKLGRKGGRPQKVEEAATKLESASGQWEAQAPFIYESLQALDETRCNQLRDLLTQYLTHESDKAQRIQADAEETLNIILEVITEKEIQDFSQQTISGKPKLERRTGSARPSIGGSSSLAPPSSVAEDDHHSENSGRIDAPHTGMFLRLCDDVTDVLTKTESKLRRLGTMLGRRRQSIHGGFGQLSPQRGHAARLGSSHGSRVSPRASSNNLTESANRLSSLVEQPNSPDTAVPPSATRDQHPEGTNGVGHDSTTDLSPGTRAPNGATSSEPQPLQETKSNEKEPQKDAEGFTVPVITHDPISQAEKDAADENGEADQFFKVNIQKEPIAEEDPDAKKAALSNVANTLSTMGVPARRVGTIRGRRDIRSAIYIASPELTTDNPFPASPALSSQPSPGITPQHAKPILPSESSIAATSDTQSVRSGNSLSSITHFHHPDVPGPGLSGSIIEAVSATFEGGEAKSVKVVGEIALACSPGGAERERIRINDFSKLEAVGPNRIFVHSADNPGEYVVDTSHFSRITPAFTYKVAGEDSASAVKHVPLIIKTDWRPQGDKLGLLLQYGLNPDCQVEGPLELHNLVFFASYVGRAAGAQLKPPGTHLKDRHIVYWRLGDVTLKVGTWEKAVCRIVGAEGTEVKPGHVKATWEYAPPEGSELGSGISVARLEEGKGKGKGKGKAKERTEDEEDDPFADDTEKEEKEKNEEEEEEEGEEAKEWTGVFCKVKTIGGKYETRW
ncbi:Cytoskeletal protein syp1 [Zalerion maritima]|uniref:Cytoskeletal protein syp1 n=1 Tax=Zalerion maritima TaxID=339359 RepID=A0AAD5RIU9_9PEZI|nr:Cytoskeletal protein syp1 [Zalerion maritima]